MMRIEPRDYFKDKPCSYVSVGVCCEDLTGTPFGAAMPEGLRKNGYLTISDMNKYIRDNLRIFKKYTYQKVERVTLKEYLKTHKGQGIVCVPGQFVYVREGDYWSYVNNDNDEVICEWRLKESEGLEKRWVHIVER